MCLKLKDAVTDTANWLGHFDEDAGDSFFRKSLGNSGKGKYQCSFLDLGMKGGKHKYMLRGAGAPEEIVPSYWLPEKINEVNTASWQELNGCNLFFTSTLTGCRFVIRPEGVSHISGSGHGTLGPGRGWRDDAEEESFSSLSSALGGKAAFADAPPPRRRALTLHDAREKGDEQSYDMFTEVVGVNPDGSLRGWEFHYVHTGPPPL